MKYDFNKIFMFPYYDLIQISQNLHLINIANFKRLLFVPFLQNQDFPCSKHKYNFWDKTFPILFNLHQS